MDIQDKVENNQVDFVELKSSKPRSVPAIVISGICGVVASTAAGWFLSAYAPKMDTQTKTMIMKAGVGLVSGSIGTFVASDISNQVDETVGMIGQFREEVEAMKAGKGKEGIEIE